MTLPNKLIAIKNADKAFHENWFNNRNPLNFPHPFRGVLLGPPNVGKSTCVKNILLRAQPPFKRVIIIHCDADYTQEYSDMGNEVILLSLIPAPEEFEGKDKTLVILDDLEFKTMDKQQKHNLDRLFGYVSTHKKISCCLCSQDPFNVPPIVRRCSNLWVLWKSPDVDSTARVAGKTGMTKKDLLYLFKKNLKQFRDSLWIDMSAGSPYPLRKNGFEIITKESKNKYSDSDSDSDSDLD